MRYRAILTSIAALVTAVNAASAQEVGGPPEQSDARRYTVEMIIFTYAQSVSAGTEVFPPDLPPPENPHFSDAGVLQSIPGNTAEIPVDEEARSPVPRDDRKYEIVMLARSDFELVDTIRRLERLDAYKPLVHFGWTQAMVPDETPEPRPLRSFTTPPDGLDGELTLYLSRYLHLVVDLQMDAPGRGSRTARDGGHFADNREYPVRYRIDEDRIFRNGELRYFDHPKFGVLAKITRVEEQRQPSDPIGPQGSAQAR